MATNYSIPAFLTDAPQAPSYVPAAPMPSYYQPAAYAPTSYAPSYNQQGDFYALPPQPQPMPGMPMPPQAPQMPYGQVPMAPAMPPMNLRPIYDQSGQVVAFVALQGPQAGPQPAQAPRQQVLGQNVLRTASAGLGVAGLACPPIWGVAAIVSAGTALDSQLGHPVATAVGWAAQGVGEAGTFVANGVVSAGRGIGRAGCAVGDGVGNFFGSIFGRHRHD